METNLKSISINFGISRLSRIEPGYPWEERVKEIPINEKIPNPNENFKYLVSKIRDFNENFKYLVSKIKDSKIKEFVPKKLPKRCFIKNYLDVRKYHYVELPTVTLDLMTKPESYEQSALDLYLIWVEERKEWVSFIHSAWYVTAHGEDELEDGPFSLDYYCIKLLCMAYEIPYEKVVDIQTIAKKSPSELEEIVKNIS